MPRYRRGTAAQGEGRGRAGEGGEGGEGGERDRKSGERGREDGNEEEEEAEAAVLPPSALVAALEAPRPNSE